MATLDELVVRIRADATQLEREMKRVSGVVQQSANGMRGGLNSLAASFRGLAPAVGAAALVGFGKRAVDAAGHMVDLADRIGFASGTLSALETRLATTGATVDDFGTSVNLMNANVGQAVSGNEQMAQAFARLGLSVERLKTLSPEQQFYAIADALAEVGTQYEQTELGRAIFGRGFASIIPLIKEANGDLEDTVKAIKDTGDALSGETLARVDAFGDAMAAAAIRAKNEFLSLFAAVLQASDKIADGFGQGGLSQPGQARGVVGAKLGVSPQDLAAADRERQIKEYAAKARAGGFVTAASFAGPEQYGPKSVKDYGTAFGPTVKAAVATRAATRETEELSDATERFLSLMERGRQVYDDTRTPLETYNAGLAEARELLAAGAIDADTFARYQGQLRDRMGETEDSAKDLAVSIRSSLANAFEDALFDARNFGDGLTSIFNGIARQIARAGFIDPLSNELTGLVKGAFGGPSLPWKQSSGGGLLSGIGGMLGFADGGRPPVGVPSVVGERGPEIFVPKTAGTIVPNHALGGQSVNVNHTWVINDGVTRQELAGMIPLIEARTRDSVFAAIEQGGRGAQIVGRRN